MNENPNPTPMPLNNLLKTPWDVPHGGRGATSHTIPPPTVAWLGQPTRRIPPGRPTATPAGGGRPRPPAGAWLRAAGLAGGGCMRSAVWVLMLVSSVTDSSSGVGAAPPLGTPPCCRIPHYWGEGAAWQPDAVCTPAPVTLAPQKRQWPAAVAALGGIF